MGLMIQIKGDFVYNGRVFFFSKTPDQSIFDENGCIRKEEELNDFIRSSILDTIKSKNMDIKSEFEVCHILLFKNYDVFVKYIDKMVIKTSNQ